MTSPLDRALKNLANKGGFDVLPDSPSISNKWDINEDKEKRRLARMEAIWKEANDLRVARCEAKMAEVGGLNAFLDLTESGEWSDSEGMTEIEKEYWRLWKEQHDLNWFREHGKSYDMKDDPNAKF